MKLKYETKITEAHHPRVNGYSIADPNGRYRIAYNVFTPQEPRTSPLNSKRRINLVFVHGAQLGKNSWLYLFEMLFDQLEDILGVIVSLDTINHGDSYKLNKDLLTAEYNWHDGGKDIINVVNDAKIDNGGQTILVGHSMGGAQVHYAAYHEPGIIDSIIAIDPIVYTPKEMLESPLFTKHWAGLLKSLNGGIVDEWPNEAEMLKYTRSRGVSRTFHPRCLQDYIKDTIEPISDPNATVKHKTPKTYQFVPYLSSLDSYRNSPNVARMLNCEVLQLVGEHADWQTEEQMTGYTKLLRYPHKAVIKNGGHLVPFQQPEDTSNAIAKFVRHRYTRFTPETPLETSKQIEQVFRDLAHDKQPVYSKL